MLHGRFHRIGMADEVSEGAQVVKRLADADLAAREKLRRALLAMSKQTVDRLDAYLLAAAVTLRDPKAAVATLLDTAPIEEKVEWFDELAGQYLVYQLPYERKKDSSPEESAG